MPNIPGIVGYQQPGAYTVVRSRQNAVSLPGGPTVLTIMGQGKREEILTLRAEGNGADGYPAQFDPRLDPDGRYFRTAKYPIISGTFVLWLNPKFDGTDVPLVRISSTDAGAAWNSQFPQRNGFTTGTEDDGYGGITDPSDAGTIDERDWGLDGYQTTSDGSGFFDSAYGRQFGRTVKKGQSEPQHYYLDETTGQIILDHPLNKRDFLLCSYIGNEDPNDYEVFTDLDLLFTKHGYPSTDNTISLAAQIATENGAPIISAIHSGLKWNSTRQQWLFDPYWSDAFAELEKHEDVNFVLPIVRPNIYEEPIMPFYTEALSSLTGGGTYLQETVGGDDAPGINVYPLATESDGDTPQFLELYKNETLMQYNVDYTVEYAAGPDPVRINLTTPLEYGDKIVANYKPLLDLVATVQQVGKEHCELMSDTPNRKERIMFTGGYEDYTITEALDEETGVDNNFGDSFRALFFMPERVSRVVNGETVYLDGQYVAAAAAGKMAGNEYLAEPLTRKVLTGFDIPANKKYTDIQERLLGEEGVSVVQALNAGGRVVNGFTTVNTGNANEEEPSVVRIRDYTAKTVRELLENRFVGTVIGPNTLPEIEETTRGILQSLISQVLITDFANITVRQDPVEPRQVNVAFDIQPAYPLNWIRIDFTVGLL